MRDKITLATLKMLFEGNEISYEELFQELFELYEQREGELRKLEAEIDLKDSEIDKLKDKFRGYRIER